MRGFGWDDLSRELDLWAAEDRVLSLWWRDDDAVDWTPALARLLDLAGRFETSVALAVIPRPARSELAARLPARTRIAVLQHGYAHRNHAAAGARPVECGGNRPVDAVLDELRDGHRRLKGLFGSRLQPILAAPWNRIDPPVLTRLGELDYSGISAFGPRAGWLRVPRIAMVNAHVDPLDWRSGARFAGRDKAIRSVVMEIEARRAGTTERGEPLGLLTHHLDHDEEAWAFVEGLLRVTGGHPAARWADTEEVFALGQRLPLPTGHP
jgi:hypothetical protein